jgi:hypothetical protein
MGKRPVSELSCDGWKRPVSLQGHHPVHVRVVAQQRRVRLLGQNRSPRIGVPVTDCAEQGSGQQDVTDRAEAHNQDIRGADGIGHGQKVLPEW